MPEKSSNATQFPATIIILKQILISFVKDAIRSLLWMHSSNQVALGANLHSLLLRFQGMLNILVQETKV